MKIKYVLMAAAAMLLASACYRNELAEYHNELDRFTSSQIAPLDDQLENVANSIDELQNAHDNLSATVSGLIDAKTAMNGRLADIDKQIESLIQSSSNDDQAFIEQLTALRKDILDRLEIVQVSIDALVEKDKALDVRITELKALAESKFPDVFDEFRKTSEILAGVEAEVKVVQTTLTNMEASVIAKMNSVQADLKAELAEAMKGVASAYADAIGRMKNDVLLQFDNKFETAIDAAREKIIVWVNEELMAPYYQKQEIEEMLRLMESTNVEQHEDIATLRAQLEVVKEEIENDISAAIKNAMIDEKLAESLVDVKKRLDELFATAESYVITFYSLEERVASLESQLASVESTLVLLQSSETGYDELVAALQKIYADLQTTMSNVQQGILDNEGTLNGQGTEISGINSTLDLIKGEIDALMSARTELESREAELSEAIATLQSYVSQQLSDAKTWAEGSFVTLEEYGKTAALVSSIQQEITDITGNLSNLRTSLSGKADAKFNELIQALSVAETEIEADYNSKLAKAISDLETSLKGWVSTTLESYMSKTEFEGKLAALDAAYKEKDALHSQQITELRTTLDEYKEKLGDKCQECILDAIADGGAINAAIVAKVKDLSDYMDGKLSALETTISGLESSLTSLEERVQSVEQQRDNINEAIESLQDMNGAIDKYIRDVLKAIGDTTAFRDSTILAKIKTLEKKQADVKDLIDALTASVTDGDIKTTIQGWIDDSFSHFKTSLEIDQLLADINGNIEDLDGRIEDLEIRTADDGPLMLAIQTLQSDVQDWLTSYYKKSEIESSFENYYKKAETWTKDEINERLDTGYFMKGKVNEMIKALGDVAHKSELEESVAKAKEDLIKGYEELLKTSIEDYGKIPEGQFEALRGGYEGTLKDIYDLIVALDSRVVNLEDRIQSIVYIPEYSDGKANMNIHYESYAPSKSMSYANFNFKVDKIGKEFSLDDYDLTFDWVSTADGPDPDGNLNILEMNNLTYSDGIISFSIIGTAFPDDFFIGKEDISVNLTATKKGNTDLKFVKSSGYIGLFATPILSINNDSFTVGAQGGTIVINVTANCQWTTSVEYESLTSRDWLDLKTDQPVKGDGSVAYYASKNSSGLIFDLGILPRLCYIVFSSGGQELKRVRVYQESSLRF